MSWQRELGEKIREARKAASVSQADLGSHAGVSRQMIGRYESGSDAPSLQVLSKLARALNIEDLEVQGVRISFSDHGPARRPHLVERQLRLPFDRPQTFRGATIEITARKGRLTLTAVIPA